MRIILIISILLMGSLSFTRIALAGPASESLGECLIDSLTGKERKQLAQWIFFAMAAHPDIKEFSKVSVDAQKTTDQYVGKLITRLMTENCSLQVRTAAKEDGREAIKGAFELVRKVAMRELMSNKEVMESISGYWKFVDNEKLGTVLEGK